MSRNAALPKNLTHLHFRLAMTVACFTGLLLCASTGFTQTDSITVNMAGQLQFSVTHILGFNGARNNAKGTLFVEGGLIVFQQRNHSAAQLSVASVRDLRLGVFDKQVGGAPMKVGKMAVPYAGGRVISLFTHKKFDTLTVEYVDANGGFHGAIFELEQDQGHVLRNELINSGAHVPGVAELAAAQSTPPAAAVSEEKGSSTATSWNLQVNDVDPGDVNLDPAFRIAIYENILSEMTKKDAFKQVFRDGDRNANDSPNLLILNLKVEKYTPGSETRRAVTTVSGATRLRVRAQLCTRDGHIVMDRVIDGNVRFFGNNLRVTNNLARNVASNLNRSPLPQVSTKAAQLPTNGDGNALAEHR